MVYQVALNYVFRLNLLRFFLRCHELSCQLQTYHDDGITWRYWPFMRGTHRSPVRSVTRRFGVLCDVRLNKRLSKHSRRRWFETPSRSLWRHCTFHTSYICYYKYPLLKKYPQSTEMSVYNLVSPAIKYPIICRLCSSSMEKNIQAFSIRAWPCIAFKILGPGGCHIFVEFDTGVVEFRGSLVEHYEAVFRF